VTHTAVSGLTRHRHFASPTIVNFKKTKTENANLLTIETIDRHGVLETISRVFVDHHIKTINARVTSVGEKAIDHFVISTLDDKTLSKEQQQALKQQLLKSL
jgi:[protein-PII] uridylyltransferase